MAKLNQVVAIEKGVKSRSYGRISELYKLSQKSDLFDGLTRTYQKKNEDGDDFPAEKRKVQIRISELLTEATKNWTEMMQIEARKDWSNSAAKADVIVDGKVLVKGAPVTFLLFLEKQVTDIKTFLNSLPTLDESEDWNFDRASDLYKTEAIETIKTKKVQRPIILSEATVQHPAQTQLITEDITVGNWLTTRHSGAIPIKEKKGLLVRVDNIINAIKEAREAANSVEEIPTPKVGNELFSYLLADNRTAKA